MLFKQLEKKLMFDMDDLKTGYKQKKLFGG